MALQFTEAQANELLEDTNNSASVYAYLTASADTTISVAGTWYPIQGTFTNEFVDFELDTDKIKYIGTNDYRFEIDWHAKVASDAVAAKFNISVSINGTAVETAKMGAFAKTAGEPVSVSGTEVVTLTNGDTIQLVCQAEDISVLTFGQFVTSANKFLITRQ